MGIKECVSFALTPCVNALSVDIIEQDHLCVDISDIKVVSDNLESYQGSYTATPKAETEVVLATKGKAMLDDITVQKIPCFDVSNEFGNTIYIASEV